jgi:hypothetical protein
LNFIFEIKKHPSPTALGVFTGFLQLIETKDTHGGTSPGNQLWLR